MADDLHGAFAEWTFLSETLTKAKNHFYSMSINPDFRAYEFTRAQYFEYIERVEEKLGLSGQPRAIIFHEKHAREHCHVVWSRCDVQNKRAIHISHDKLKLMALTIEFAREHDLTLPKRYFTRAFGNQISQYENYKKRITGLSKEEHRALVTEAWQVSDSARAFTSALEERGYILATGDQPYVLVDIYGGMHTLPRALGLKKREVLARLEKDLPPEKLLTVEDAKKAVAEIASIHRSLAANEQTDTAIDDLKRRQELHPDRVELDKEIAQTRARHEKERAALKTRLDAERAQARTAFRAAWDQAKRERDDAQRKGLTRFFRRLALFNTAITKTYEATDRWKVRRYRKQRAKLAQRHASERQALKWQQILEKRKLERRDSALRRIEKGQLKELKEELAGDQRTLERGSENRMPAIKREKGKALGEKGALTIESNTASGSRTKLREQGDLSEEFAQAAGRDDDTDGGGDGGHEPGPEDSGPDKPKRTRKPRQRRRKRDRGKDYDRGM
jgi:hypothetical protein